MVSLEQVNLLEVRVANTIDYVKQIKEENAALVAEKASLLAKLEANHKRIDELEVLIMRFKEDQGRIEDGIIAALDRLSQFEEAFESSLKDEKTSGKKIVSKPREASVKEESRNKEVFFEIPANETVSANEAGKDSDSSGELDIF